MYISKTRFVVFTFLAGILVQIVLACSSAAVSKVATMMTDGASAQAAPPADAGAATGSATVSTCTSWEVQVYSPSDVTYEVDGGYGYSFSNLTLPTNWEPLSSIGGLPQVLARHCLASQ